MEEAARGSGLIALDTSSVVAYLAGDKGPDVLAVEKALADKQGCLPPVVLTELLSDPRLPVKVQNLFTELPLLPVTNGYWARAGALRNTLAARGRKAPLADVLIAQSCIDHDVALVTRDADFRSLQRLTRLRMTP